MYKCNNNKQKPNNKKNQIIINTQERQLTSNNGQFSFGNREDSISCGKPHIRRGHQINTAANTSDQKWQLKKKVSFTWSEKCKE